MKILRFIFFFQAKQYMLQVFEIYSKLLFIPCIEKMNDKSFFLVYFNQFFSNWKKSNNVRKVFILMKSVLVVVNVLVLHA